MIGVWVEAKTARMAWRDPASVFHSAGIEDDTQRLTIEIATWIGREEVSCEDRRCRLASASAADQALAPRRDGDRQMTRRTGAAALLVAHLS